MVFKKPTFDPKADSDTQSAPYDGGQRPDNGPQGEEGDMDLHDAAVKAVENQHGPFAKRSPNYQELVKDAEDQIRNSIEANKSF